MIEIRDLTIIYNGKGVLCNINLDLKEGEIIGLVGENGSGKTTLLRILSGLERNYEGSVKINGEKPGNLTNEFVAYEPDHLPLDDTMKIKDVVDIYEKFYADFDSKRFYSLLNSFEIESDLRIKECSKGMKDKIQIALTLSRKAKVYLLDEPMSGVDPKSRKAVLNTIIENFNYDGLLLLSTHLISEVEKILDRAIFLDDGKVIVNDTIDDIRDKYHMGVEEYFTEVM